MSSESALFPDLTDGTLIQDFDIVVKSSEVLMPTIVNKFVNSVQLKTFPNALHKSATPTSVNNIAYSVMIFWPYGIILPTPTEFDDSAIKV